MNEINHRPEIIHTTLNGEASSDRIRNSMDYSDIAQITRELSSDSIERALLENISPPEDHKQNENDRPPQNENDRPPQNENDRPPQNENDRPPENIAHEQIQNNNLIVRQKSSIMIRVLMFFSLTATRIIALALLIENSFTLPEPNFEMINPLQIQLINMYSDFSQMPNCAEKNLLRLKFFTSVRTLNDTQFLNERDIHLPSDLNLTITEELKALNESLRNEELIFDKKQELKLLTIQEKVQNETASKELDTLLKEIRPLDTNELYRLIMKSHDAASLIKDQEIILLLGLSGSGKSTTIHFLGGSEMVKTKEKGLDHIAPIKIRNLELTKVFTSATIPSLTKYITPVSVNLEDIDKRLNGSIILCDSPGFEDTSGAEIDIANGVGIIKALQSCKSVKPIIMISSQLGDKLGDFKGLMTIIAGMISGIKDKGDTFLYFFTKFSQNDKDQIIPKLENLRENLSWDEKYDSNLVDLINNIIEKTKTEVITIDPINDNPKILLKKIQESPSILSPGQVFQYSITQSSQLTIKEQVERYQSSIKSGIERFDFPLVKYKLDELRKLYEVLQYDHISVTYESCANYCAKKLTEIFKSGISSFNKCLVEQNSLNEDDITQYKELIERAHKAEEIINAHLGSKVRAGSDLLQNIPQETNKMLQSLKNKRVNDTGVSITLNKLKLLSTQFSEVNSSYVEGCKIVKKTISDTVSVFKDFIESDKFERSANEMKVISQAKSILKDHISSAYLDEVYQDLEKFVWSSLNNCTDGPNSVFAKEILDNKDVLALKRCISRIEVANKTHALKTYIPTKNMNEMLKSLNERLLGHSKEVDNKMIVSFQKELEISLKKIEQKVTEMSLISTIPSIDPEIVQTNEITLGKFEKAMLESKAQIENTISVIQQQKNAVLPELEPEAKTDAEAEAEVETESEPELEMTTEEKKEETPAELNERPELTTLEIEETQQTIMEESESTPSEPNNNSSQETEENPGISRYFWYLGCVIFIIVFISWKYLSP